MMLDSRINPGDPYSDIDIDEIERIVGRKLPEDYINFVKTYGGAFVGGYIGKEREMRISGFFNRGHEEDEIIGMLNFFSELTTDGHMPFADDSFGDMYVMKNDNSIYYLRKSGGVPIAEKVCENFTQFLDLIYVVDE